MLQILVMITMWIKFSAVPYFGMVQGNRDSGGDPSINIILPNGKVCPPNDHGIPDFDLDIPTYAHGLVEHRGVVYKVGGVSGTEKTLHGKESTVYEVEP